MAALTIAGSVKAREGPCKYRYPCFGTQAATHPHTADARVRVIAGDDDIFIFHECSRLGTKLSW